MAKIQIEVSALRQFHLEIRSISLRIDNLHLPGSGDINRSIPATAFVERDFGSRGAVQSP